MKDRYAWLIAECLFISSIQLTVKAKKSDTILSGQASAGIE